MAWRWQESGPPPADAEEGLALVRADTLEEALPPILNDDLEKRVHQFIQERKDSKRLLVEGFVVVAHGWQWNGEQSAIDIVDSEPGDQSRNWKLPTARLVFADDRTYREALRNDGFLVRAEGVEVRRGSERLLAVESIRTATR